MSIDHFLLKIPLHNTVPLTEQVGDSNAKFGMELNKDAKSLRCSSRLFLTPGRQVTSSHWENKACVDKEVTGNSTVHLLPQEKYCIMKTRGYFPF